MKRKILTKTTIKCRRCFHQRRARCRSHSPYSIVDSPARTHIHFGSLNISASKYPKIVTELYSCVCIRLLLSRSLSLSFRIGVYVVLSLRIDFDREVEQSLMPKNAILGICMWWFCVLTKWKTRFHINLPALPVWQVRLHRSNYVLLDKNTHTHTHKYVEKQRATHEMYPRQLKMIWLSREANVVSKTEQRQPTNPMRRAYYRMPPSECECSACAYDRISMQTHVGSFPIHIRPFVSVGHTHWIRCAYSSVARFH